MVILVGPHFGSNSTGKISKFFEDLSRNSVFFSNRIEAVDIRGGERFVVLVGGGGDECSSQTG